MNRGTWGEDLVAQYLGSQGMTIVRRNFRSRWGEVDIIARDGDVLAFVEVRTRAASGVHPLETVDRRKRQRLWLTAQSFLARTQTDLSIRFDCIAVIGNDPQCARIEYIKNAFAPGE